MKVSVFATLGRRGQLIQPIPLNTEAIYNDFTAASEGCVIVVGRRTYKEIMPIIGKELKNSGRMLVGWTPSQGRADDLMRDLRRTNIKKVLIIGGAHTFNSFHAWVNDEIMLNYTNYDCPLWANDQLFFPLELYGQTLPKACMKGAK